MNQKIIPSCTRLSRYIEYYWIVRDVNSIFHKSPKITSYAGITPELVFPLDGKIGISNSLSTFEMSQAFISTIMHENILLDFSTLKEAVVVRFKTTGLAALLPFLDVQALELAKQPLVVASQLFGQRINEIANLWKIKSNEEIAVDLDEYFAKVLNEDRAGFLMDSMEIGEQHFRVDSFEKHFSYSKSTLERKFKKETGLSPKRYMMLKRFRSCMDEIIETGNTDWMHYVVKYQYYDQSHFIKEMKRFSGLSPELLIRDNCLPKYRPNYVNN